MSSATKVNATCDVVQFVSKSNEKSSIYTHNFFGTRQAETWKAASRIVAKVLELVRPTSVIDVGCGTGEFLAAFREHRVEDILGIDGAYVQPSLLVIPQESFMPFDLKRPFTLDRTYDLVVCLEVAEHLPPASAGDFIASLARLGSTILFSAAIPYQGDNASSIGHLNEQWPEYWAALFKQHGFVPVDALRRSIWQDREIPFWYRQNMLFFCTEEVLAGNEKLTQEYETTNPNALSMIHPEMFLICNTKCLRILRRMLTYVAPLWRKKIGKRF